VVSQQATREFLAGNLHLARTGLAAMFLNQEESTISDHVSRTIGTFLHVLLSGLVLQWLMDPASALSAKDLTEALRSTAAALQPGKQAPVSRPAASPVASRSSQPKQKPAHGKPKKR
jgi:hypothetical protein